MLYPYLTYLETGKITSPHTYWSTKILDHKNDKCPKCKSKIKKLNIKFIEHPLGKKYGLKRYHNCKCGEKLSLYKLSMYSS